MKDSPRMTKAVPDILARIVSHKHHELARRAEARDDLEARAEVCVGARRDFRAALKTKNPAIIAEIKKASPSKGLLCNDFRPDETAIEYERGGAAAISILTDEAFFQGSLDHLEDARSRVTLPVLRKDFTISEYHVIEAAAHEADAILLIVAVLDLRQLTHLRELASHYRMASIVEVHDRDDLQLAIDSGAEIIGVNNRNLRTFEVDLNTSIELADQIPAGVLKISESGIETNGDIRLLQSAGFHAFLIGEHLMRAPDRAAALRALLS